MLSVQCCACPIFVHIEASYAVVYAMDEYNWYIENYSQGLSNIFSGNICGHCGL
jgi:hypothetical protein